MDSTDLNAMVIDIKDDFGYLHIFRKMIRL